MVNSNGEAFSRLIILFERERERKNIPSDVEMPRAGGAGTDQKSGVRSLFCISQLGGRPAPARSPGAPWQAAGAAGRAEASTS